METSRYFYSIAKKTQQLFLEPASILDQVFSRKFTAGLHSILQFICAKQTFKSKFPNCQKLMQIHFSL